MHDLFLRGVLGAASIGIVWYQHGTGYISIDGERLMEKPRPSPFHMRWLLPAILGDRMWWWTISTWLFLVGTCLLFPGDIWACALWVSMPWFRTMAHIPVLVDSGGVLVALAASRFHRPMTWRMANPGLALALVGGAIGEKAPVFAALYAWRWELLVGLAPAVVAYFVVKKKPRDGSMSALQTGRARAMRLTGAAPLLLPWGAGMAALLDPAWSLREIATVLVAYLQLAVAYDTSRMYMWAAPVVLPKAIGAIPQWLFLPAAVLTWLNPYASPGKRGEVLV